MASTDDTYYNGYVNIPVTDAVVPVEDECRFDLTLFNPVSNTQIKEESDYVPSPDSDRLSIVTTNYTVSDFFEELSNEKQSPVRYVLSDTTSPVSEQLYQVPIFNPENINVTDSQVVNYTNECLKEHQNREEFKIVVQKSDPLKDVNCVFLQDPSTSKQYRELDNYHLQNDLRSDTNDSEKGSQVFNNYQDNRVVDSNAGCVVQESQHNLNSQYLSENNIKEERNSSPEYEVISDATSMSSDEPESHNFKLEVPSNIEELQSIFQVYNRFNSDHQSKITLGSNLPPVHLINEQKQLPHFTNNCHSFWNQTSQYPVPISASASGNVGRQVILFKRSYDYRICE